MTLRTVVYVTGSIHPHAAYCLGLSALMIAAGRQSEIPTAQTESSEDAFHSVIGQGLPGIVWCRHSGKLGVPLSEVDVVDDDGWIEQHACDVELSWDTAYGYREDGLNCTELHVAALIALDQLLPEGVSVRWQDEYRGTVHAGVTGEALGSFLGTDGSLDKVIARMAAVFEPTTKMLTA